ncbi:MAG: hypothetical protein FH761_12995 [Firmicutes bacterium]|nr:hypothetical protein [Bacillota bacterium]
MESLVNELKEKKILSQDDISKLREHIEQEYPNTDIGKRASLLSRYIYKSIDNNLNGFSKEHKEAIKKKLVEIFIYQDKGIIDKSDVLFICSELQDNTEEFLESLTSWINSNIQNFVRKEDISEYIACAVDTTYSNDIISVFKKYYNYLKEKICYSLTSLVENKDKKIIIAASISLVFTLMIFSKHLNTDSFFKLRLFGNNKSDYIDLSYQNRNIMKPEIIEYKPSDFYLSEDSYYLHIPDELRYKVIDREKLKKYLKSRNSILYQEPYFSSLIDTAEEFGLNPNVLFAITGQEQSFVPIDHEHAEEIANNPFNVFGSWVKYNTNIKDSSEIAARTICNLLKNKPNDVNSFKWINRKYAEDKRWWWGVNQLYEQLEEAVK